jgi:hypothetical protein
LLLLQAAVFPGGFSEVRAASLTHDGEKSQMYFGFSQKVRNWVDCPTSTTYIWLFTRESNSSHAGHLTTTFFVHVCLMTDTCVPPTSAESLFNAQLHPLQHTTSDILAFTQT